MHPFKLPLLLYICWFRQKGQDAWYAKESEHHAKCRIRFKFEKSFNNIPTSSKAANFSHIIYAYAGYLNENFMQFTLNMCERRL